MFEQTVSLIPSKWNDWKGMANALAGWLEKVISGHFPAPHPPKTHQSPCSSPCPASALCMQSSWGWLVFQPGIQGPCFATRQNLNAWNDIKNLFVLINAGAEAAAVFSCCAGSSSTWHSTGKGHLALDRSVVFYFLFFSCLWAENKIKLHKPPLLNWTLIFTMN